MHKDDSSARWFRVEVTDRYGQVVAIESEMLTGRDIGESETQIIIKAINHLSGFIGHAGLPAVRMHGGKTDQLADRAQYVARAAVDAAAVGDSATAATWLTELDECVRKLSRMTEK
jgi:hypothetical protein